MMEILLTMGIDPGSKNCMVQSHNRGCDIVKECGESNLTAIRQKLRDLGPQSIEQDTQYNNKPGSVQGPFASASQATTSCVELTTGKVVHVITANQLCKRASRLMREDKIPDCPSHADGTKCTANLNMTHHIGDEPHYFRETAQVLKKDGVDIKFVTTDGDSKIGPVIQDEFGAQVEHFRDTRHFSATVKKGIVNNVKLTNMFTDKLKVDRNKQKRKFAEDVRKRVSFEFKRAVHITKHMPDAQKKSEMFRLLKDKTKVIIKCLKDDHSDCTDLCDMWRENRLLENGHHEGHVYYEIKETDEKLLIGIINKRLGQDAIAKTWRNENTQKCEALHRMYIKTNPKQVTYIRNYRARILRSVLVNNLGFDGSTTMILQSLGHSVCGGVQKKMTINERLRQSLLENKKKPAVKKEKNKNNCITIPAAC